MSHQRASASPVAQVFAQSTTSAYDNEINKKAEDGTNEYFYSKYIGLLTSGASDGGASEVYTYGNYESKIDPELQADLRNYQA